MVNLLFNQSRSHTWASTQIINSSEFRYPFLCCCPIRARDGKKLRTPTDDCVVCFVLCFIFIFIVCGVEWMNLWSLLVRVRSGPTLLLWYGTNAHKIQNSTTLVAMVRSKRLFCKRSYIWNYFWKASLIIIWTHCTVSKLNCRPSSSALKVVFNTLSRTKPQHSILNYAGDTVVVDISQLYWLFMASNLKPFYDKWWKSVFPQAVTFPKVKYGIMMFFKQTNKQSFKLHKFYCNILFLCGSKIRPIYSHSHLPQGVIELLLKLTRAEQSTFEFNWSRVFSMPNKK